MIRQNISVVVISDIETPKIISLVNISPHEVENFMYLGKDNRLRWIQARDDRIVSIKSIRESGERGEWSHYPRGVYLYTLVTS